MSGDDRWRERSEEKDTEAMKKCSYGFLHISHRGVALDYHSISKSAHTCIINFLLELKQPIIWNPFPSAFLVDYDTSSALLVEDVTGLHVSLVSFFHL